MGGARAARHISSSTCLALNALFREEILVHIRQPEGTPLNHFRRIIWCPFIPEESEDCCEEGSPTVALLHEDRVRGLGMGAGEGMEQLWCGHGLNTHLFVPSRLRCGTWTCSAPTTAPGLWISAKSSRASS